MLAFYNHDLQFGRRLTLNKMARTGETLILGIPITFIIIIFFLDQTAASGCQSDYSDWMLKPYCSPNCKKIGIRGTNQNMEGRDEFPSGVFGVYRRSGNANFRTKYTKAGGWMIKYGCVGDAEGGDADAWYVTKDGESSGAVLYSPYQVTCPSDTRNWWVRGSPGNQWGTTGRKNTVLGDYVQVVCNPNNEEDFAAPATKEEEPSNATGGAMSGEMNKHTLGMFYMWLWSVSIFFIRSPSPFTKHFA